MKLCIQRPRLAAIGAALVAAMFTFAGCKPDDDDETGEGEGEVAGEGEGEQAIGPNEDCATAIPLGAGVTTGTTAGANDDLKGFCELPESGIAPDVVYKVTLTEPSALVVKAEATWDVVLYAFNAATCGPDDLVDNQCVDERSAGGPETLTFTLLPAGDYFVVVDGFPDEDLVKDGDNQAGPFTLTVAITPGGICGPDPFEPVNDAINDAPQIPPVDFDTTQIEVPNETPTDLGLSVCANDTDLLVVSHMGGSLTATAEVTNGSAGTIAFQIRTAVADPAELADGNVVLSEGPIVDAAMLTDAPRGLYLLKVTGSDTPVLGTHYGVAVSHGCEGDVNDSGAVELDDETDDGARISDEVLNDERRICGRDVDGLTLEPLGSGEITVRFTAGAALGLTITHESFPQPPPGGTTNPAPRVETLTVQPVVENDDLLVRFDAVGGDDYHVRVRDDLVSPAGLSYQIDVHFSYNDVPANDTCGTAALISALPTKTEIAGRTLGATDDFTTLCNGDNDAGGLGHGAPDVAYELHLSAATNNLALTLDGGALEFEGSLSLYKLAGDCPADVSTLPLLNLQGELFDATSDDVISAACSADDGEAPPQLEVGGLPAGDYLVVVDGVYEPETASFGELRSAGFFTLTTQLGSF